MNWTLSHIEELKKKGKIRDYRIMEKGTANHSTLKKSKYGNEKTVVDNIQFDSKKEAKRYCELKILLKAGKIGLLEMQKVFELTVNDVVVARYKADFSYFDEESKYIVEDVKSEATKKLSTYRLKKKLMKQIYNIEIIEK